MGSVDDMLTYTQDVGRLLADYWTNIEDFPPKPRVQKGDLLGKLPAHAPQKPESWDTVLDDVKKLIIPGLNHHLSPNDHSYLEAGTSAPSVAAEQLTAGMTYVTSYWAACPSGVELELRVMDWLGQMLRLPEDFLYSSANKTGGGAIQESASLSCVLMMVSARKRAIEKLRQTDPHLDEYEVASRFLALTSDQSHVSIARSGAVTGIRVETLETEEDGSLSGTTLSAAIHRARDKGLIPIFYGSTLGTTTSCAFDNLMELGPICQAEGLWLHVDAAFAGTAFICPEFRPLLDGVEFADSFLFSAHKTMLTSLNCCCLWLKDRKWLGDALKSDAAYLSPAQDTSFDPIHMSMHYTRSFRSLKLWFLLRLFGVDGLQAHVRKQKHLLDEFGRLVAADDRFEMITALKTAYGVVCFRMKGSNELNEKLRDASLESGKIFFTTSVFKGRFVLRFAVCNALTEPKHVHLAWREIQNAADNLMQRDRESTE